MGTAQVVGKQPLDEVMQAMDVVDTLRHRRRLVERELGEEGRRQDLIARLRQIYAAQGIEVTDQVLQQGVDALEEDRFNYDPPQRGVAVKLAEIYISRGRWGKPLLIVLLLLVVVGLGYQYGYKGYQQNQLAQQESALQTALETVRSEAQSDAVVKQAEQLFADGRTGLQGGDGPAVSIALARLQGLAEQLQQQYQILVVSGPGQQSGVWRIPESNPSARNYYLIVEAVSEDDGSVLTLPVTSEEDGKTRDVKQWGLRVSADAFEAVRADKQDDGIVQERMVGDKRRGELQPEYRIKVLDGAITQW